jgi:uncharacterized protein YndB with AHSA1/START domain
MRALRNALAAAACVILGFAWPSSGGAQSARVLDDFNSLEPWRAEASDGVSVAMAQAQGREGGALRLDFDFHDVSGYAFVGRTLPLTFPENFEISFWMRADAPVNTLEVKFVDASGENVWWRNQPNFAFPGEWTRVVIRKRQIEFAWGPTSDRTLRNTERIEFVVTRGAGGGGGSVTIDQLEMRELPAGEAPLAPIGAVASQTLAPSAAAMAFDADPESAWRARGGRRSLTLDLGAMREFGGLELAWAQGRHARDFDVHLSNDGVEWRRARRVIDSDGGRDLLRLPESEARYIRLDLLRSAGRDYALADVRFYPPEWAPTANAYLEALAERERRGVFPRGFVEQSYWTLIGADGAADSALIGEDGAVEVGKGGFSIEPFVRVGGDIATWADVEVSQSMQDGYLPIPSVTWTAPDWRLATTAFVEGERARSTLVTRYVVTNTSSRRQAIDLLLAVRPLQVNGPRQFLNMPGGAAAIMNLTLAGDELIVNERARVWLDERPDAFSASRLDSGLAPFATVRGGGRQIADETGFASGALVYRLTLAPGETRTVAWCAPLTGEGGGCGGDFDARQAAVAAAWRTRLSGVEIEAPDAARPVIDTLRSSLAHILMSRDGAMLKPGTRSYDRSWIRDGAMIAEGLIRLGAVEEAAEYLTWYAPYQFDNGKIPCCVDRRGADPTPENDSHGEFIFLAAEVWRATRDERLLRAVWPRVESAVRYMDGMRASEMAPNRARERRHLYGLMPPSISHEGYSARPAYSYWDDFWTLLGYKEAVVLAQAAGDAAAARRIAASRDAFRRDLYASLRAMRRVHGVDYIPGAADLGDFDATSTTIALSPGGEQTRLPRRQLEATFERYWREFVERREGRRRWDAYTPYEIRNVGAFVRLGWRERAYELLTYFMADRRPQAWNGWAEVVGRDARERRFIGDMPHAWISSDYIRSALELFVYRREADEALVLAAGVPAAWLEGRGVSVRGLRTAYGSVSYTLRHGEGTLALDVAGDAPPGGFVLPWPLEARVGAATFNGRPLRPRDGAFVMAQPGRLVVQTE